MKRFWLGLLLGVALALPLGLALASKPSPPKTYTSCLREAAKMPTERGVHVAVLACRRDWGQPLIQPADPFAKYDSNPYRSPSP